MMKFGLPTTTLLALESVFSACVPLEKVVIYGSRAKGNYREGSDIDLTLFGSALTLEILSHICWELEELNTPYLFDVSIYDQITSEDLKVHINQVGQTMYLKK